MLDPAFALHQCWSQPRHQLGHIQLLSRVGEEGHEVIQLLVDFGVPLLPVPLLQQHLLRTCCLHQPQEQGLYCRMATFLSPRTSAAAETSSARKQVDHLQSAEHHLGVIEEGVEEAEEPQRPDLAF